MKNKPIFIALMIVVTFFSCKTKSGSESVIVTPPVLSYPEALFTRVSPGANSQLGLFMPINTSSSWYNDHVAAASILKPAETKDGKWRMYVRGSTSDGHGTIGMFEQETTNFNPTKVVTFGTGGWIENSASPVLSYDSRPGHEYEQNRVLSPAPVVGPDGNVYLYYVTRNNAGDKSVCEAISIDAGECVFTKYTNNPMISDVSPSSFALGYGPTTYVVYENGFYYHFSHGGGVGGSQMWLSKSTSATELNQTFLIIPRGTAQEYDSKSIEGGRIFKVTGSDKWFMVYSVSATHGDYPERLHCAWTTDAGLQNLQPWHKVVNNTPFFMRGHIGQWDQGAMWTGDIIEVTEGSTKYLYMYYEAWGKQGTVVDRDVEYFAGGHSQIGIAKVSTQAFLEWAGNP